MYLEHFGFRQWPFSMVPNPDFFLNLPSHQAALNTILIGLKTGEGLIKVTGPVGAGKTLLCRKLWHYLEEEPAYYPVFLSNPPADAHDLLHTVLVACKSKPKTDSGAWTAAWHHRLQQLRKAGKRVVLVIDEAQAWSDAHLEMVRLWSNWQTEDERYLQIILVGQLELDQRLQSSHLRQLLQRVSFSHRLLPMTRRELTRYMVHRLAVAGVAHRSIFEKNALDQIYAASKGLPRLVNILAHKALMVAYGKGMDTVSWREVRVAVLDTESARNEKKIWRNIEYTWKAFCSFFGRRSKDPLLHHEDKVSMERAL